MPDPFDPTLAQPSPDGLAAAHVDPSTIALLAEVELDAAAIAELVQFLRADDPDLPSNWHLPPLLLAAEHLGSCPVCSGVRAGVVGAAAAALSGPVPGGTVATREVHLAAALAAFDGSTATGPHGDTEVRAAGLAIRNRRPWRRPRTPRAGLGVGPASGGTSGGSPSSNWAFVRDRRVLLAVAVVLAISVPLVVNGGRRNRPAASKAADTTSTRTTVADTTAAARSKAAGPTGAVATQAEDEPAGGGIAEADTTSASTDQATTGAAPVIASADLGTSASASASASGIAVPVAPSAPLASVSTTPATTQPTIAPATAPAPSTKSAATPVAAKRSAVSTQRPSDAALATARTTVPAAATGVLARADAAENAGSKPARDLGTLGSFTDDEAALVAFTAAGSAAPTGALAAKAPAPVPGDVSAPAAAAPAASGADGRCVRALIGADTVARADINGVAILIVSFSESSPGRVQLLTADGCAVRLDRTR